MKRVVRNLMVAVCAVFAAAGAQTAGKPAEARPALKSALDKATFEAYIRHLFVWNDKIKVSISDAAPSPQLPGFYQVAVHATSGQASQDEMFYVSKDGRKILRAMVFDINQNPFKDDLDKLKTEFQPSMGTPNAPVVIVVFTDFECPFCKEEAKMLRANLLSAYPTQVRLYFKDFPLTQIHPWAMEAAIAGRCVFRQNPAAFWEYHDWVYDHQAEMTAENFRGKVLEWAKGKDLDTIQLTRCLDTQATKGEVEKSLAEGRALQIRSTPTMFINGRRLEGQVPWPNLREIIDYEIEYQKTARNAGENCGCDVKLESAAPAVGPVNKLGSR